MRLFQADLVLHMQEAAGRGGAGGACNLAPAEVVAAAWAMVCRAVSSDQPCGLHARVGQAVRWQHPRPAPTGLCSPSHVEQRAALPRAPAQAGAAARLHILLAAR